MSALSAHHQRLLELVPQLPDEAIAPVAVAAALEGVSTKTIRRRYPLVKMGERLKGVPLKYLRRERKIEPSAA